jgi:hypothetical protein
MQRLPALLVQVADIPLAMVGAVGPCIANAYITWELGAPPGIILASAHASSVWTIVDLYDRRNCTLFGLPAHAKLMVEAVVFGSSQDGWLL